MIILIAVACFLFWGAFQNKADSYYKLGVLLLFVITAFRHPALGGTDNMVYYNLYCKVPTLDKVLYFESDYRIGFILFVSLSKTICDSYLFFQIFYTVFTFFLLCKVINQLELSGKEKCLYLFTLYCSFGIIWDFWVLYRQNIANLVFAYFMIMYLKNHRIYGIIKKIILLLLAIIIPYMFHSSAFFNVAILPILFMLPKIENVNRWFKWVLLLSISLFAFGTFFWGTISAIAISVDDRYAGYAESAGVTVNIINFLFKLFLFWLYCKNYEMLKYQYKGEMMKAYTISLVINSINVGVVARVGAYYAFGANAAKALIQQYKIPRGIVSLYFMIMMVIFIRYLFTMSAGLNSYFFFFWESLDNLPIKYRDFWSGINLY